MHEVIDLIKEKLHCIKSPGDFQDFPSLETDQFEDGKQFEDGLVKAKEFLEGKRSPNINKVIKASQVSTNGATPD